MRKLAFILFSLFCCPFFGWAQQSYEDSLNKVIALGNEDEETIKAYNELGYEYTRKNAAKAKTYFAAAIDLSKKINSPRGLSNAYSMLVYLHHDNGRRGHGNKGKHDD